MKRPTPANAARAWIKRALNAKQQKQHDDTNPDALAITLDGWVTKHQIPVESLIGWIERQQARPTPDELSEALNAMLEGRTI